MLQSNGQVGTSCFGTKIIHEDATVDLLKSGFTLHRSWVVCDSLVISYYLLTALCNPALDGRGLGVVSGQQAGESVHREFQICWEKYKY